MNNILMGNTDYSYYETIAGGCGAGPGFHGASGVHHHMTNTRMTDPEVLEKRFPVRLEAIEIVAMTVDEALAACRDGTVKDSKTLATLLLAQLHGWI